MWRCRRARAVERWRLDELLCQCKLARAGRRAGKQAEPDSGAGAGVELGWTGLTRVRVQRVVSALCRSGKVSARAALSYRSDASHSDSRASNLQPTQQHHLHRHLHQPMSVTPSSTASILTRIHAIAPTYRQPYSPSLPSQTASRGAGRHRPIAAAAHCLVDFHRRPGLLRANCLDGSLSTAWSARK